ncbi:MAG: hypothetical protein AAF650_01085 [Pseudomonadota bacterium]
MPSIAKFLITQSWIAPAAMGLIMVFSLFDPAHNAVGQHMSELILGSSFSQMVIRILPFLAGVSIIGFAVGVSLRGGWWSALISVFFGTAMVSAGIVPMGSVWHGMYGLAILSVLLPVFYCLEFEVSPAFRQLSFAISLLGLVYMWFLLVGLDPSDYRGLTQRSHAALSFGWFILASRTYKNALANKAALISPKGM